MTYKVAEQSYEYHWSECGILIKSLLPYYAKVRTLEGQGLFNAAHHIILSNAGLHVYMPLPYTFSTHVTLEEESISGKIF